jgi:uncharacterized membrane protein HdeD (DUF308 family)
MTDSGTITAPLASLAKGVWWLLLLRGVFAVLFGIIALAAPGAALTGLAIVFGAYAVVDGITAVVHAVQIRKSNPRWAWLLVSGVLTTLAGLIALVLPGIVGTYGGLFVLWTIIVWSFITGVMGLRSAAGAHAGRAKTVGIVSGILSIVFAVILAVLVFVTPFAAVLTLVWTVGIWAIIFGVMLIVTAIMVRSGAAAATS